MCSHDTRLEDIIGLNYTKLGFFRELQIKMDELRSSNLELDRKHQEIRAIVDGISDVLVVISTDYKILACNHAFGEVFNYPNPFSRYCYEIFRNRNEPCANCPLETARKTNHVCRRDAIIRLHGQNRQFEITASPIRNSGGNPTSMLVLKRDVTMEKEYQAKYYHAEKMATIGLLSAGVAHEINNPLTAISGFAEGIRRRLPLLKPALASLENGKELDADLHEYIETILSECNRCRDIVSHLLTFSPRKKIEFSVIDFNELVKGVLKLLHHQLKYHSPEIIRLELDPTLPTIRGITAELKQVVLNLVQNALDAVREKGHITIRTTLDDKDKIILFVEDTGCGIKPQNMGKLFDPFFTTKPVGKGIGIGLSTCYNIIKQHRGEIYLTSNFGKGSTFKVVLPRTVSK
jgi:hypothetical protein